MGRMSWGSPYTKQTIGSTKRPKKKTNRFDLDYVTQTVANRGLQITMEDVRRVANNTPPDIGQGLYHRPADANRAYVAPITFRVVDQDAATQDNGEQPDEFVEVNLRGGVHIRPWWRVMADDEETDIDRWVDNIAEVIAESDYTTVTAYLLGTNNDAYFIECCNIYDLTVRQMIELVQDSVDLYLEDRVREQVEIERPEDDDEPDEDDEPVF